MANTTFTDGITPVGANWLNEINDHVYNDTPITPSTTVHDAGVISNTPAGTIAATNVQSAINELDADIVAHVAATAAPSGSSLVGFIQSGTGAVARTAQDEFRDLVVSPSQFGADPTGVNDSSSAVAAANTYAQSVGRPLVFKAGTYNMGSTSFAIDPQKTRWVADGVVSLQWASAPASGYAIRVVAGDAAAYATGRKMVSDVLDGIAILGGASYAARYTGNAIEIGDGTNYTYGINFQNVSVQGWSKSVYYNSNTWAIRFTNPRFLWGDVDMPSSPSNFGENNSFVNPFFADNTNVNIRAGEWTLLGGSLDNGSLVQSGLSTVKWFGPHFENPGSTDIASPYVSLTHSDATAYLHDVELVTNNSGVAGSITTAPFNVDAAVVVGGLHVDGFTFTQHGAYGFDSFASGTGRARFTNATPLALSNANYMQFAAWHPGALRNYGFEENSTDGWTVTVSGTSTVAASAARKRTGSYSGLFTCSGAAGFAWAYATQKTACSANQFVTGVAFINRDFTGLNATETGVINCKLEFLDADGAAISSNQMGSYSSAANGTDDGTSWVRFGFAAFAPIGAVSAQVRLEFQRPTGTGTALFYVDDVLLNVC